MNKHSLKWFEEYAERAEFRAPLDQSEWNELAKLLHDVNESIEVLSELSKRLN